MVFMSMGWDCVSELRPPMDPLFISQMIYEHGALVERYDREKPKSSQKDLSQCHFVHHRSHYLLLN
jgi:hypothetical protein